MSLELYILSQPIQTFLMSLLSSKTAMLIILSIIMVFQFHTLIIHIRCFSTILKMIVIEVLILSTTENLLIMSLTTIPTLLNRHSMTTSTKIRNG